MALMPMLIKFGQTDQGTLHEQFCPMQQLYIKFHKKLVEGQLWTAVTHVTIWGHMKVLPSMCQVI